jgi:hypothetical protein
VCEADQTFVLWTLRIFVTRFFTNRNLEEEIPICKNFGNDGGASVGAFPVIFN